MSHYATLPRSTARTRPSRAAVNRVDMWKPATATETDGQCIKTSSLMRFNSSVLCSVVFRVWLCSCSSVFMVKVQICIWRSWCHCHPLSLAPDSSKSRLVLPSWFYLSGAGSPRLPWTKSKRVVNGCVYVCSCVFVNHVILNFVLKCDTVHIYC